MLRIACHNLKSEQILHMVLETSISF